MKLLQKAEFRATKASKTPYDKRWVFPEKMTLDQADKDLLKQALREMRQSLQTCTKEEASKVIISMRIRYGERGSWRRLSDQELSILGNEWVQDLAEYPTDIIDEAYGLWRHSRTGFPPSDVGEMIAPLKPVLAKRQSLISQIEALIAYVETHPDP